MSTAHISFGAKLKHRLYVENFSTTKVDVLEEQAESL